MTVNEMFRNNPSRKTGPPESLFLLKDKDGITRMACMADVAFDWGINAENKIGELEVVKEFLTQSEIEEWSTH